MNNLNPWHEPQQAHTFLEALADELERIHSCSPVVNPASHVYPVNGSINGPGTYHSRLYGSIYLEFENRSARLLLREQQVSVVVYVAPKPVPNPGTDNRVWDLSDPDFSPQGIIDYILNV